MRKLQLGSGLNVPKFGEEFIQSLHELLNRQDDALYEVRHEGYSYPDTYWFIGPESDLGNAELRIALGKNELVISRVLFVHRRQGVMTAVFKYLQQNAPGLGCSRIGVESACTPEMVAWCRKNGFRVLEATDFESDGVVFGDYVKDLD